MQVHSTIFFWFCNVVIGDYQTGVNSRNEVGYRRKLKLKTVNCVRELVKNVNSKVASDVSELINPK